MSPEDGTVHDAKIRRRVATALLCRTPFVVLSVASILVGFVKLGQCHGVLMIPVIVIVYGVILFLDFVLAASTYIAAAVPPYSGTARKSLIVLTVLNWLVFIVWNIVLCAYVFPYLNVADEGGIVEIGGDTSCDTVIFVFSAVLAFTFVLALCLAVVCAPAMCGLKMIRIYKNSRQDSKRTKESGVIRC